MSNLSELFESNHTCLTLIYIGEDLLYSLIIQFNVIGVNKHGSQVGL